MGLSDDRKALLKKAAELLGTVDVALEIGVHYGEHAREIDERLKPNTLYLLDAWGKCPGSKNSNESQDYWRRHKTAVESLCKLHPHMRMIHGLSLDHPDDFADETFDFIYFDATHTYEAVSAELSSWFPKLKQGGILAGDDYADKYKKEFGVVKAVTEFREQHADNIKEFTIFGKGLGASWLIKMKNP